ncbi:MAG: SDR family NAD(P)-dependent oxidoreductase [Rhodobacteraceae bacterium]|nr:SDR family NAD(P)-dependent oxidoreductase [Paracoccaceae bacterium]
MSILITGGTRGIGAAIIQRYADLGLSAQGTSRDGSVGLSLDVTDPESVNALGDVFADRSLDLLVCNAGVFEDRGLGFDDLTPTIWHDSFAVNVVGVAETIRVLLPALRRSDAGKVAIIASQMGSQARAPGGSYVYRATKAAAINLGRNLATDLRPEGIAVGIYHPGWVRTDMGGASAEISPQEAAIGLVERFRTLSIDSTGCFETWDGQAHPL